MTAARTRRRSARAGGSGDPIALPTYIGQASNNLPENNGVARAMPSAAAVGDYVFAWALGVGTGSISWSGGGWTSLVNFQNGNRHCIVYGKFVQPGDPMSYTPSASGLTGAAGLLVYRNVQSVHATRGTVSGGNAIGITFPSAWASTNVGSMALIFDGNDNQNDYPVHTTIEGWRRDVDARRWHYGGAVWSTPDPGRWKSTASMWSRWGWHAIGTILMLGYENRGGTLDDALVSTTRPVLVTAGGIGWSSNLTVPAGLQQDDFLVIVDYRASTMGFDLGAGEQGWWGVAGFQANGNNIAQAHGVFLNAGDAGSRVIRLNTFTDQSRAYVVLRGVHKTAPWRRRIGFATGNTATFGAATAGVNTMWLCSMGANLGAPTPNLDSTSGWSYVMEHNRWAPWGAVMLRNVSDGEVVSGLSWDVEQSYYALGSLVELRGAA